MNRIAKLKPLTCKVRTLGWKPKIEMREPGGTLTFNDDETRKGLFAYGRRNDYHIRMEGTTGKVGRWTEGALYDGEPDWDQCDCKATEPNATTNQMIRIAESWEAGQ